MPPVFSRAAQSRPIPGDIIIEIGRYLCRSEQRSMLLACWMFHDTVVPLLYRHLDVWLQPSSWEESEGYDHLPYRLLSSLARSARHRDTSTPTRCYARYVFTFRYLSYSLRADLRAMPLLTEFLRFACRLRHLAIDVCRSSVPLMLEIFHRNGIIRSPPASFVAVCIPEATPQSWILPALDSVRSPKAPIVIALMRYRAIRTAIIDTLPGVADMESLLGISSTIRGSRLVRLSLTLPYDLASCLGSLRAITVSFPSLKCLSVRTAAEIAGELFKHSLRLLADDQCMLPQLQCLSINHTSTGLQYGTFLEVLGSQIAVLGEDRSVLDSISLGDAMWRRVDADALWELKTRVSFSSRAWAEHRAVGLLSLPCAPPTASRRIEAINTVCLELWREPSVTRTATLLRFMDFGQSSVPVPRLAAIEMFLLGSEASVIEAFFAGWTPDLILRLRPLSSSMRLAIEAYCARQWDIDMFLARWFEFVPGFLKVLDQCDGVVSGSEAQQFFGRQAFRGRDLDIYVPLHGLMQMGRWLKEQGFVYHATADKHPLFDVAAVMFTSHVGIGAASISSGALMKLPPFAPFNFARAHHSTLPAWLTGMHVQLIAVPCNPVEFIVNHFHSTGVMNYMTGKYAVSLFPRTTFVERTSLICQDITRNAKTHRSWIKKYRNRGFKVIGAGETIPYTFEVRYWQRRVGDFLTWVMPFDRRVLSGDRGVPLDIHRFAFEVLPYFYQVAPAGAAIRVGPRFVYSSMALMANPSVELGHYRSLELDAAFGEYVEDE
ncbi:hypothetical protein FKP32DRAFT_1543823, partial [Trametes sanguinea]